jgi:cobalt/nickel transport system permease protein
MKIFSEHFRTDHFLTKIDARVKLVVVLTLLLMVISSKEISFPLVIATGCFLICLMMKVPPRVILLRTAEPLVLAAMVLLLKFLFTGNAAMFSFSIFGIELTGHRDGLIDGIKIAGRILGGVSLVVVLGFSTPFSELMAGLSWMKVPKQFIEIMMFAYRYIFVFLEDGFTIYNAQKNRLGYTGIKNGLKSFGTLTGSLVLRSFEQSQKTSEAMAQRGYTGDMPLLKNRPFRASELALAAMFIIIMGSIWMIT